LRKGAETTRSFIVSHQPNALRRWLIASRSGLQAPKAPCFCPGMRLPSELHTRSFWRGANSVGITLFFAIFRYSGLGR